MTASEVTKRLKLDVWPLLRERGFVRITDRRASRRVNDVVHVLEFRSLGTYLGSAVGATPSSLVVNVGVYYDAVHRVPWATTEPPAEPEEPSCQARLTLRRSGNPYYSRSEKVRERALANVGLLAAAPS